MCRPPGEFVSPWMLVCATAMILLSATMWKAGTASADERQPISQEELKMTSVPEAPGAAAADPAVPYWGPPSFPWGVTGLYVRIKVLTEEERNQANVGIGLSRAIFVTVCRRQSHGTS